MSQAEIVRDHPEKYFPHTRTNFVGFHVINFHDGSAMFKMGAITIVTTTVKQYRETLKALLGK
jgi:hypothetical protein